MTRKRKVLIADDHTMFADGLRRLLEADYDVIGTVDNGRKLVEESKRLRPEVVIVDISMPSLNGIEATRQLLAEDKRLKVIVVTMHGDAIFAARATEAGASGYLLKHCAADELLVAMREVLCGRTYISPRIAGDLLQIMRTRDGEHKEVNLTGREREVLQLIAEGKSMKEIAVALDVSTRTVEYHRYNLMDKTRLRTTGELTRYAVRQGIVDL